MIGGPALQRAHEAEQHPAECLDILTRRVQSTIAEVADAMSDDQLGMDLDE